MRHLIARAALIGGIVGAVAGALAPAAARAAPEKVWQNTDGLKVTLTQDVCANAETLAHIETNRQFGKSIGIALPEKWFAANVSLSVESRPACWTVWDGDIVLIDATGVSGTLPAEGFNAPKPKGVEV